ncbi:asparagine synthase-related protein [Phenylobacterium montanum]|uniref:asparagine synthase (glutamine-hydrolyzing) n=1 Tax=Phenylobacterium montanum TaxID=2823693 RepID=A0A975G2W0_9CAUL|nr:asparagine synthetase B family protein [Caulobacter sp. S6]QUD90133.1 hypothetical protein KCG34_09830 [Caulobacter sp. S6]
MARGYFAILPAAGAPSSACEKIVNAAQRSLDLRLCFEHARLVVLAAGDEPATPIDAASGMVLGEFFQRGTNATLDGGRIDSGAVVSGGLDLLTAIWGGYVAFLLDQRRGVIHVLRDPSGAQPCYRSRIGDAEIVYSDLVYPLALGLIAPRPDPGAIAHHLSFPDLRTSITGLVGVEELLAGCRVSFGPRGGVVRGCGWTPWRFADRESQLTDRAAAVARVRQITRDCVTTWGRRSRSILLELSGGLDSSIVAACLAEQAPSLTCATLTATALGPDEQRYAAAVARGLGAPLELAQLDPAAIDPVRGPGTVTARPWPAHLTWAIDAALQPIAATVRPDAFFSGGGGDNAFCYLPNAAPAADALLACGFGATFVAAILDLAELHGATVWRAAGLAVKKALRRPTGWRKDGLFLCRAALPDEPAPHPWLDAPTNALPGKLHHVMALMSIQTVQDRKARAALAPVRFPLLSQPLMEACLTVPSWMWIAGGRNRSVAREAFADDLPPLIVNRRTKGDFAGICRALFETHREAFKELLLGGWLDAEGILDRPQVEGFLGQDGPLRSEAFYRLLEIAAVEAWARSWLETPARPGSRRSQASAA